MDTNGESLNLSILVIEDNPGDQLIIREVLRDTEENHFTLKNCSNLKEALNLIKNEKFDAIILDLGLPDSEGANSLLSIKSLNDSLPIIVLTVNPTEMSGIDVINYGAQDFITKRELEPASLQRSIKYAISRKKLELELKESLTLNESIFDQAAVGLVHLSLDFKFIKINQKFCDIVGYHKNELLGKHLREIAYPEDLERDMIELDLLISGKEKSYSLEKRFIHKDGSIIWTTLTRSAIINTNNQLVCFFTTYEDITQSKLLEIELQRQKDILDNIIDILPVGVWITDSSGKIMKRNKSGENIWSGAKFKDFGSLPEYKGWWANSGKKLLNEDWALYRAVKKGETSLSEIINIESFDGSKKTILNSAVPILNNDEIMGAVAVSEDITQIIEAENRLKASINEKEILLKENNHRIKNNLQLMRSLISLTLHKVNDEDTKRILLDTSNRIMSISNLHEKLHKSAQLDQLDIQSYLYAIIDSIRESLFTYKSKIKFVKNIESFNIGSAMAISLGLILNELVTNAVKYAFTNMPSGTIYIEINQNKEGIFLIFKDDGIGLPDNIDIQNSDTLGFQIMYSLVAQHNGKIDYKVESGTEVIITIPNESDEDI